MYIPIRNTVFLLNARQTVTNETVAAGTSSYTINRFVDEYERPLVTELSVNGTNKWLTAYGYDDENNIRSVTCTNSAGRAFTVDYTNDYGYALGYKVILPQGDAFTRTIQRDPYHRYLITACSHSFNGLPLKSSIYSFDSLNRATQRIDGGTITNTFAYNARSEVSSASILSNAYTFAYDFIGNHTTSSVDSVNTTYSANNLNQYIQIAGGVSNTPSYDSDGNMLTNGVWAYTWDAENRLTAVYSNSVCVVSNAYAFMNRRIRKVTPSVTTTFVYDGWNLIHETIATTNSSVSEVQYFWGVDLSGSPQGAGGVGGLLAVNIDGSFFFPLFDNNGNITAYASETGNLVAEFTYDAFGETIAQSSSMADAFRFRFSTKYYDSETRLYYYGMRFYSPDLHRWINRDPIEEEGGLNQNAFCKNNAISFHDVLGMKWTITRDGMGTAYVESDCDSIINLAIKTGLSVADYKKWLSPVGNSIPISPYMKLAKERFRIPNTVYAYWAGDVGFSGRSWVGWNGNVKYLRSLGFMVVEYMHSKQWQGKVQRILENAADSRHLHGLYFWGHGYYPYPSAGLTNSDGDQIIDYRDSIFNDGTISGAINLAYKMPLALIYACDSNSGKSALSSESAGSIWHGYTGTLYPVVPFSFGVSSYIKHGNQGTK